MKLEPCVLDGRFARLEPYAPELRDELRRALDVDPEAWAILSSAAHGERFDAWWETAMRQLEAGSRIPYAVRRIATGELAGTTSFLSPSAEHRNVEIGATFYGPAARGGPVNPECKRLMLGHAFAAGALRVELVTDARNVRSQAAIRKLGAQKEGALRRHKVTWTGHVRDTVVFSITDEEWPEVRAGLDARLSAFGAG
jgi:RimJ/RimL family protein N-acetyltransferase